MEANVKTSLKFASSLICPDICENLEIAFADQQERDRHPGPNLKAPHQRRARLRHSHLRVGRGRAVAQPPGRRRLLQQRHGDGPPLRRPKGNIHK